MNSSASASSSPVVTPGRTCSPISASVSATIRPARAICSISWGDLRMIMRNPAPAPTESAPPLSSRLRRAYGSGKHLLQRGVNLGEDLVDRPVGVEADDIAARRAVVLDERRGLAVVDLEALPDRLRRVV